MKSIKSPIWIRILSYIRKNNLDGKQEVFMTIICKDLNIGYDSCHKILKVLEKEKIVAFEKIKNKKNIIIVNKPLADVCIIVVAFVDGLA